MNELHRLNMYKQMVRIRQYEARILQEYHADKSPACDIGAGLVPGEMHLSAGQEPAAVGVCAHLKKGDAITAPHRPHHFALAHGVDLNAMTAEIFGRLTGLSHGKGGHMHLFDPDNHLLLLRHHRRGHARRLGRRSPSNVGAPTTSRSPSPAKELPIRAPSMNR